MFENFWLKNSITNSRWYQNGFFFRIKSLSMFLAFNWYTLQISDFSSLAYVRWLIWATKKVMLNNISLRFTLDLVCSVGWHFAIGNFQSVCFHSQCKQNFIPKFFLHFTHVAETHIRISCGYHFWVTSPFQGGYIIILLLISNICSRYRCIFETIQIIIILLAYIHF